MIRLRYVLIIYFNHKSSVINMTRESLTEAKSYKQE